MDLAAARENRHGANSVTLDEYLARPRKPIAPFAASRDGRTVVSASETTLLLAGPSGAGKSLLALDLVSHLVDDDPADWLGLRIYGRRRVFLISLEGSDEDTRERLSALVTSGHDRVRLWDRWQGDKRQPSLDVAGQRELAAEIALHRSDVVFIDTGSAMFGSGFHVDRGEEAGAVLEAIRYLSGLPLAFVVVAHTRKADRGGARGDELEEVAGTFGKKADAAIVLRRVAGDEEGPRRHVIFAKVRRGPQPKRLLAAFPDELDAPPRLTVLGDSGRPVRSGTEAEEMAQWIGAHDLPVAPAVIRARFGISETTLSRDRRPQLEALGIARHRRPGKGNGQLYGTAEQWCRLELGSETAA